jgi:multicomponent K+:H+ antiporter subunit G
MTHLAELPTWAAVLVAVLLVVGAGLAAIGSIGLLRLGTFYERVHAPTLGATLGIGLTLIASMLCFSVLDSRPVLHELLIAGVMVMATPIAFTLLARAALYRDGGEEKVAPPPRADSAPE